MIKTEPNRQTRAPRLVIRGLSTISAVGATRDAWASALLADAAPCQRPVPLQGRPVFPLPQHIDKRVADLSNEARYQKLDRTTYLALACTRETLQKSRCALQKIGCISIGSSRGATSTLEETLRVMEVQGKVPAHTSPSTTAGALSSWVAQACMDHIGEPSTVATISTSMTCSSAFHSLLVAHGFVASGMAESAIFGGSEACLTPYTLAQLEALRIYSECQSVWPCRPCADDDHLTNSVTLGEGAGTGILMPFDGAYFEGDLELLGIGWSMEQIPSATGISTDGVAFAASMRHALASLKPGETVDLAILHAPGSRRGDEAELGAIRQVLGEVPMASTKHITGHTYGASGMVSLALADALLSGTRWNGFPYPNRGSRAAVREPDVILINTAGFGGNAISVIVGRPAKLPD